MPQLAPIELSDGTTIMIESSEDIAISSTMVRTTDRTSEEALVAKDGLELAFKQFKTIKDTIKAYTTYSLDAFKELANTDIDKVSLEFGVKVGGEIGIPYITKGTAESNLKVTVECSFPPKPPQKE